MKRLFANRRTDVVSQAIDDLAESNKDGWMPALMYLWTGQPESAVSLAQCYLAETQDIQGHNPQELACVLAVLKLIYTDMERPEEAASIDERFESIRDQIGDVPISRTMIEALYDLAVVHQGQDDPKSNQRAFIMAYAALALSVIVYERHLLPELAQRLFSLFRSLGFPPDCWGWLTRRCDFRSTDCVGLISVLIDEGMFPQEATELLDLSESDPADGRLAGDYRVTRMIEQSWISYGFSEDFPMSVADGELSMRAERFLEEAGRCLRNVGELSSHVLLFSSHSAGNHIAVLEQDTSSEEKKDLCKRIIGGLLFEYGADSVMVLNFTSMRLQRDDKSLIPSLGSDTDDEISVEARDSKSYIAGRLKVRRSPGGCQFRDIVLSDAEDGVLSDFTLPVKPGKKSLSSEM